MRDIHKTLTTKGKQFIPSSVKLVLIELVKALQRLELRIKGLGKTLEPNPIFILGNQKSGTSAVTALLSMLSKRNAAVDLKMEYLSTSEIYKKVRKNAFSFSEFINRNRYDFSKKIIKEANLTPFYSDLAVRYPEAKFVFVVRNPKDNIRSILDRLKIPGDLKGYPAKQAALVHKSWDVVMDGSWLGLNRKDYIGMLAERWNYLADIYIKNHANFTLIRYEDFLLDKTSCIRQLAGHLDLSEINDISDKVDIQYQPKGNAGIDLKEFFGTENFNTIERICKKKMQYFNYD